MSLTKVIFMWEENLRFEILAGVPALDRSWPQQTRESKDRGETVVRQRRARDVMEDIQFDGQDDGNLESMDLEALTL